MQVREVLNKITVKCNKEDNELKLGNLFQYDTEVYIIANVSNIPGKYVYSLICLNDGLSFDCIQSTDINSIFGDYRDVFKR